MKSMEIEIKRREYEKYPQKGKKYKKVQKSDRELCPARPFPEHEPLS
jgi:hypothetical protein